jgi:flagellar hook-associated protein 1 FlgK
MAGLSAALNFARASLATVSGQTAVASRNVSSAGDTNYARKSAQVAALSAGMLAVTGYTRSSDDLLLNKLLTASSNAQAGSSLLSGLKRLSETVGDPESSLSPAGMMGKFQQALQLYEQNPSDAARAQSAVQAANALVRSLNDASATIQTVRTEADTGIAGAASKINELLRQFKQVNDAITGAAPNSADMVDNMDTRDKIARDISELMGIRIVRRPNNDMALYTDSGVTLFETEPRTVTFQQSLSIAPGASGNALYVDGVDVTSPSSPMALRSGSIFGLVKLRDETTVQYQRQMDEIARGLITSFAETDQSAIPLLPAAAGLFTWPGGPAVPPSGAIVNGLASSIRINAAIDPSQGGQPSKLRDGGVNGAAYLYNTASAAGFAGRLTGLVNGFSAAQSFDPAALLDTQTSLRAFAEQSTGWIESRRLEANTASELQATVMARASDALQKVTGVSIDDEMAELLQLERSYQASSKLISTVDQMFASLLQAVG